MIEIVVLPQRKVLFHSYFKELVADFITYYLRNKVLCLSLRKAYLASRGKESFFFGAHLLLPQGKALPKMDIPEINDLMSLFSLDFQIKHTSVKEYLSNCYTLLVCFSTQ